MDWMNSRHSTARDICHPFNYPPFLLGIPGDNTYSNQGEARLGWWEQSIIPTTKAMYQELNNWLVPKFDEGAGREDPEPLELRPNFDGVSALALRREQQWSSIEGVTFLTINEKRKAAGFDDVDGGDEIFINASQLPLSFQGVAPGTPTGENE
jgi:phage portal protein BeeE